MSYIYIYYISKYKDSGLETKQQQSTPIGHSQHNLRIIGSKSSKTRDPRLSSWWLNQPIWKICSSNWIISPGIGGKIKKYLRKPPPSYEAHEIKFWCGPFDYSWGQFFQPLDANSCQAQTVSRKKGATAMYDLLKPEWQLSSVQTPIG